MSFRRAAGASRASIRLSWSRVWALRIKLTLLYRLALPPMSANLQSLAIYIFVTHHFLRVPTVGRSIPLTHRRQKVSKRTPRSATLTRPLRPFEFRASLCNHTEDAVQNYIQKVVS
jgi:hypothetical protein